MPPKSFLFIIIIIIIIKLNLTQQKHTFTNQKKCTITTTVLRLFFRDHPGEPVPEENFWTLWCNRRLTEADTPTIRLGYWAPLDPD